MQLNGSESSFVGEPPEKNTIWHNVLSSADVDAAVFWLMGELSLAEDSAREIVHDVWIALVDGDFQADVFPQQFFRQRAKWRALDFVAAEAARCAVDVVRPCDFKIKMQDGGWWITGLPGESRKAGPYDSEEQAVVYRESYRKHYTQRPAESELQGPFDGWEETFDAKFHDGAIERLHEIYAMRAALAELAEDFRTVIHALYWDGMTYEVCGKHLRLQTQPLRTRENQALAVLCFTQPEKLLILAMQDNWTHYDDLPALGKLVDDVKRCRKRRNAAA